MGKGRKSEFANANTKLEHLVPEGMLELLLTDIAQRNRGMDVCLGMKKRPNGLMIPVRSQWDVRQSV